MPHNKATAEAKLGVITLFQNSIWEQFLPIKLELDTNAVGNTYQDYGQHQHTLSFDSWSEGGAEDLDKYPRGSIGTKTLGLWYDNTVSFLFVGVVNS